MEKIKQIVPADGRTWMKTSQGDHRVVLWGLTDDGDVVGLTIGGPSDQALLAPDDTFEAYFER